MNFSEYLYYIILFIFLLILLELYLKIARRFGIMDLPNLRSSHREETITGGGIIFYFVLLVYFIVNQSFPYFFIGATIIALLGFLDDRYNLPLPSSPARSRWSPGPAPASAWPLPRRSSPRAAG